MFDAHEVTLTVNGKPVQATVDARMNLADFLRHDLRLTGTHVGCEHGVCGACTVLVDGASVRACLMLAVQADGRSVETIESMADGKILHPIQAALARHHGLQCGYCTPGVVMTLRELDRDRDGRALGEDEIRAALSGNLCRCTGYQGMVDAVLELFGANVGHLPTHD
ncbi:MAG: 2Fe-2S iron-sulfur cluster binding protein [Hyphomicrobiales bacterium]|nr:2Fe-2S iron-sulfur cluster binding protein [Hyphomicrobiales bacterium]